MPLCTRVKALRLRLADQADKRPIHRASTRQEPAQHGCPAAALPPALALLHHHLSRHGLAIWAPGGESRAASLPTSDPVRPSPSTVRLRSRAVWTPMEGLREVAKPSSGKGTSHVWPL